MELLQLLFQVFQVADLILFIRAHVFVPGHVLDNSHVVGSRPFFFPYPAPYLGQNTKHSNSIIAITVAIITNP
jgi:hypothetical protein